jgi:hypothetical protein
MLVAPQMRALGALLLAVAWVELLAEAMARLMLKVVAAAVVAQVQPAAVERLVVVVGDQV